MATREENIKKINDELEKLDDEQLEKVAGGVSVWNRPYLHKATDGNQNTNTTANQFVVTEGYRPNCMPKDSPL